MSVWPEQCQSDVELQRGHSNTSESAVFDKDRQRPTAIEMHQWIEEKLKVRENQLQTLQLAGKENAVYLKFVNCGIKWETLDT